MQNRILARTRLLDKNGGKSLAVVIMIADPDIRTTFELVELALEEGVDVFEIGIPISEPVLDSDVMHDSMNRALDFTADYNVYLKTLKELRQSFPQAVFEVMIYHKTVMEIGFEKFCAALIDAQMDCVLVADAVFIGEEFLQSLDHQLLPHEIYPIRFVPSPFNPNQIEDLKQNAHGFIVVQTIKDAEGRRDTVLKANQQTLSEIRKAGTQIPLVLAYGIRTPDDVHSCLALGADGVLIGTVLLDAAYRLPRAEYRALLRDLRIAAKPER